MQGEKDKKQQKKKKKKKKAIESLSKKFIKDPISICV